MNQAAADKVLKQLAHLGVETLCLCPGARNAPLISLLANSEGFNIYSFYDERSAGFFALGRSRRDQRPVVVCTTSGTAVSELLSPVIEAFYSNTALVVLSADRPKRLRGTGAPQAIDQTQIFSSHVEKSWDVEAGEDFDLTWSGQKPIHINLCFDEPLIDSQLPSANVYNPTVPSYTPKQSPQKPFADFPLQQTLLVVGALTAQQATALAPQLESLSLPIFAEALSGLKGSESISNNLLLSGEKIVSRLLKSGDIQSVIRIGDVPVGRYWRDLDTLDIPVLSISDKPFPGLARANIVEHDLLDLNLTPLRKVQWDWQHWKAEDAVMRRRIEELIRQYPKSEVALVEQMSQTVEDRDQVYIGNSLPIRIWDLVSKSKAPTFASRGVNGIDGQLSTAIGLSREKQKSWALLGDLTTLYDFSGMWLTSHLKESHADFNLVVINNKGGQIFSRIFAEPLFRNSHDLEFSKFAEMWGWNYQLIDQAEGFENTTGLNLIEVRPDPEQSQKFWQSYDQIWKK